MVLREYPVPVLRGILPLEPHGEARVRLRWTRRGPEVQPVVLPGLSVNGGASSGGFDESKGVAFAEPVAVSPFWRGPEVHVESVEAFDIAHRPVLAPEISTI